MSEPIQRHVVLVLGMHRSGTSAVARALLTLGLELGDNLLPPVPGDNDKGYWEDSDIQQLNQEILSTLQLKWDSVAPCMGSDWVKRIPDSLYRRAFDLVDRRLSAYPCYGLKDPRLSLLLPFWQHLFGEHDARLSYLITYRHPLSVAQSIGRKNRRGKIPALKSHLLWLWHQSLALVHTEGARRTVVSYDRLLEAPSEQINRVASALDLPIDQAALDDYIETFIDPSLCHSKFGQDDLQGDPQIPPLVAKLYQLLEQLAVDKLSLDSQKVRSQYRQVTARLNDFHAVLEFLQKLEQQLYQTENALVQQKHLNGLQEQEEARLKHCLQIAEQQHSHLEQQHSHLGQQHSHLEQQHSQLEQQHSQLEQQHSQLGQQHSHLEQQHSQLEQQHSQLEQQHSQLEQQIRATFATISWRITAPLRFCRQQEMRMRHAIADVYCRVQQRGGALQVTRRLFAIFRESGWRGVQAKLAQQHSDHESPAETENGPHYSEWVVDREQTARTEKQHYAKKIAGFKVRPLISIIMPTYNSNIDWLVQSIESVLEQLYPHWQLCIADDCSTDKAVRETLDYYQHRDSRIQVIYRRKNGNIAAASNSALTSAEGEWVGFLDHDDMLSPDALYQIVAQLDTCPDLEFIYTDEDKISPDGDFFRPFLKPDWSPHLASAQAYVGHFVCLKKEIIDSIGGFDPELSGAQDYDLWLQAACLTDQIFHLPHILYHWRMHPDSTALTSDAKPYAHVAGQRAVAKYLHRRYPGHDLQVVDGDDLFTYKIHFPLQSHPLVSIIIPTKDKIELLRPCIDSILSQTTWENYEILVLDNNSVEPETDAYLSLLSEQHPQVRCIPADMPFNWSVINNYGADQARGDVLVFLNNDTKVISSDWLNSLAGFALLPDTGCVGALLLYEDGRIQHSGVVVGMNGWADHLYQGSHASHLVKAPFISPVLTRNVLAVTGACMAISKQRFQGLGGLDESFIVCGSDVELGLRAFRQGFFNLLCGQARLYHYESKTRSSHVPEQDFRQSEIKYSPYRTDRTDPFYNPGLSLSHTYPHFKGMRSHE